MNYQSWVLGLIVCLLSFGLGCSQRELEHSPPENSPKQVTVSQKKQVEKKSNAYVPSTIEPEFPVPKQVQKTNYRSKKPAMKYVRYSYQGLTDVRIREPYFTEIEKWGWIEQKEEQMGSMHLFTKREKRIQITIHQEFFTLFINE